MRTRETIEREIYQAREDLEARLNELRQAVKDKIDVKARAQAAIEQRKQQARELGRRGVHGVKRGAVRTKNGLVFAYRIMWDRRFLVGGIAAGVLVMTVATVLLARRSHRPWYERC
jgi:hypothetical protein